MTNPPSTNSPSSRGRMPTMKHTCPKYLDITALHELAKSCPGGVGIEALRYAMEQE
jgi:hypothetical protein